MAAMRAAKWGLTAEVAAAATATIFSLLGDLAPHFPFCLEEVELAFSHGHQGLVSVAGEVPVKVVIMLGANVLMKL
jgi:hypothetical protein